MANLSAILLLASLFLFIIGFFNPQKSLFWDKKGPTKTKSAVVYGGLMILFLIVFGMNSDIKASATSAEKASADATADAPKEKDKPIDMPAEQKLAVLDANGFVDEKDEKVVRMKTLLEELASNYGQPKDTIAEYTSRAQGVLHDKGIQESCLTILEEMHKAGKIDNTPYRDAITLYLLLRVKQ